MSGGKTMLDSLKQKAKRLKKEVYVLYLVYSHPGVPWYKKLFILLIITYAFSPIDLIPDFIPVLGALDDLFLIPLGIIIAMKMIPKEIWDECRLKVDEGFQIDKSFGRYGAVLVVILWLIVGAWVLRSVLAHR